jgi:type I restriction enzyme M protein
MSLSSFIWSVADLLRGDYKQSDYGKVILPFTVLRRMDCVLEKAKESVLTENKVQKKRRHQPGALSPPQGQAQLLQHVTHEHEDPHG